MNAEKIKQGWNFGSILATLCLVKLEPGDPFERCHGPAGRRPGVVCHQSPSQKRAEPHPASSSLAACRHLSPNPSEARKGRYCRTADPSRQYERVACQKSLATRVIGRLLILQGSSDSRAGLQGPHHALCLRGQGRLGASLVPRVGRFGLREYKLRAQLLGTRVSLPSAASSQPSQILHTLVNYRDDEVRVSRFCFGRRPCLCH
jgi:hypothetical protein